LLLIGEDRLNRRSFANDVLLLGSAFGTTELLPPRRATVREGALLERWQQMSDSTARCVETARHNSQVIEQADNRRVLST